MPRIKGRGSMEFDRAKQKARVRWSYTAADGSYATICKTFRNVRTKAAAWAAADEYRKKLCGIADADTAKMTLSDLAQLWLKRCSQRVPALAKNTLRSYRVHTGHLCEFAGSVTIDDVGRAMYAETLSKMRDAGMRPYTVHNSMKMLRLMMRDAVRCGIVDAYPLDGVEVVSLPEKDRRSLSISDARRMMGELLSESPSGYTVGAMLGLATGMRIGEVCGLVWGDVGEHVQAGDVCALPIRVSRQFGGEYMRLKTKASNRTVWLDGEAASWLASWRSAQGRMFADACAEQTDDSPIVTGAELRPVHPQTLSYHFKKWCAAHGFGDLRFHELRHTMATLKLAAGVDVKSVQEAGGWSSAAIVLDTYAHALDDKAIEAAAVYGTLLGTKTVQILDDSK